VPPCFPLYPCFFFGGNRFFWNRSDPNGPLQSSGKRDANARSERVEDACRVNLFEKSELLPVDAREIDVDLILIDLATDPLRMLHSVLPCPSAAFGIPPVMLGDEFPQRATGGKFERPIDLCGDAVLKSFSPAVFDPLKWRRIHLGRLEAMAHRCGDIVFLEKRIGDHRDRPFRDNLPNKGHGPKTRVSLWYDVKAKIHLFESTMEGDRYPQNSRLIEQKTDKTDETLALEKIQSSLGRHQGLEQRGLDSVICKYQVLPVRR